jgi:hypothetical protein
MPDDQSGSPETSAETRPPRRRGRPPNPEREGVPRKDYSGVELLKWANGVLASHDVMRGATDDDVAALQAVADAHGWGHATEAHPQRRRERRWRATVFRLDAPGAQAWVTGGATGNAPEEADALAIALARMLARPPREVSESVPEE